MDASNNCVVLSYVSDSEEIKFFILVIQGDFTDC